MKKVFITPTASQSGGKIDVSLWCTFPDGYTPKESGAFTL